MSDKNLVTSDNVAPKAESPDAPEAGRQEVVPAAEAPAGARDARIDVAGGAAGNATLERIKGYKKVAVWLREPVFVQIGSARFTVYGAEDITEPVMVYEPVAQVIANKREQERLANVRSRELRASSSYASIAQVPERGV